MPSGKKKKATSPSTSKRRKNKSQDLFNAISGPTSATSLDTTCSKGMFLEALRGEAFGPHPGLAETRIKLYVYNPIGKREVRLPGKQIDLLVGTIGEVDELLAVIRKAIQEWI